MTRFIRALAAVGTVALTGMSARTLAQDAQPSTAVAPSKQVYCPVTPTEEIDSEVYTDYKGERIYFCCDRCKVKFTKDPEKYLARPVSTTRPQADPGPDDLDHAAPDAAHAPSEQPHRHDEPAGHDDHASAPVHEHKEHGPGKGPRWMTWLGGFHPAMVNFPIGVAVAASLAELLFVLGRPPRPQFEHAARFCVAFAALTGVAAGVLGWLFAGVRLTDTDPILAVHRWLGTGAVLWLVALLVVSERARRTPNAPRRWYRTLLFGGTVLVLTTGFFGGAMVYGLDHYLP